MASEYLPYQAAIPTCNCHPNENLDYYCYTCGRRVCVICCRDEHNDHDWYRSDRAARIIRENTGARCGKIEDMIIKLNHEKDKEEEESAIVRVEEIEINDDSLTSNMIENKKTKRRLRGFKRKITKRLEKLNRMLNFYCHEAHSAKDNVVLEVEEDLNMLYEYLTSRHIITGEPKLKFERGKMLSHIPSGMNNDLKVDRSMAKVNISEKSHFIHIDESAYVCNIVSVEINEALLRKYNSSRIEQVDVNGKIMKKRELPSSCKDFIMINNDIIYSHFADKMIRCMSSSGAIIDIYSTAPLHPNGISTSLDGGILVALCDSYPAEIRSNSRGEILYLDTKGKVIRTYSHGKDHDEKLFVYPKKVVQNNNSNLCVVDRVNKSQLSCLVVLEETSHLKFNYTGQSSLKEKFVITDIVCDHHGRFLVVDYHNHAIHLLSCDGHCIQILLTDQTPLLKPRCMCLRGRLLWLGCDKGVVRVYTYKEEVE